MSTFSARRLSEQEVAAYGGFTHIAFLTAADLTTTATNTAQVFTLCTNGIPNGANVTAEFWNRVPFKDASDSAFNDTAATLGDENTANSLITTSQLNENGTEITFKLGSLVSFTTERDITLTVNSMSAKSLVNIDIGELVILLKIADIARIGTIKFPGSTK